MMAFDDWSVSLGRRARKGLLSAGICGYDQLRLPNAYLRLMTTKFVGRKTCKRINYALLDVGLGGLGGMPR